MLEWIGGPQNVVQLLVPLVVICVLVLLSRTTDIGSSGRYFLPALVLWFGLQVMMGLEQGPLVSFPYPIGLIVGLVLWAGATGLCLRGLLAVWNERTSTASSV
jgi:hypothetical protein